MEGKVFVKAAGSGVWGEISINRALNVGEEIRTEARAKAVLTYKDGSKVEIGPSSVFVLDADKPTESRSRFSLGWMKAVVSKALNRRFSVKTPTAVCSVRGTEFDLSVRDDGRTSVDLFKGALGVADNKGNEVALKEGQHVDVTQQGIGRVTDAGSQKGKTEGQGADNKSRQALKREVGLEMTKEEIQAAAALEAKNAVYQQGKAMIDVNGNRVRIEEYIIRPAANQYKFVVLNERSDRFDYFFRSGTFNKTLPDDLSVALRQMSGCIAQACEWWLTDYQTAYSNTQDSLLETAAGGHIVDVNNNTVTGDDVSMAFDSGSNSFTRLTINNPGANDPANNTPFYTSLFDTYSLKFNGIPHVSWAANTAAMPAGFQYAYDRTHAGCTLGYEAACGGIQSEGHWLTGVGDQRTLNVVTSRVMPDSCTDPDTCIIPNAIQEALDQNLNTNCLSMDNCTGWREEGKYHKIIYNEKPGDPTVWDKYDTYIIDDNGKIADYSSFGRSLSGTAFKESLLHWNYQQIITASEFNGRKIDLVFEPKILIESGIIP